MTVKHPTAISKIFCFKLLDNLGIYLFLSLDFLVKFLEQEVCKLNWDVGFVNFTMQEIGVQLPRLLEVYDQLFKARV